MPMLKLWYDIRIRAYAIAGVLFLFSVIHVALFPYFKSESIPAMGQYFKNYESYFAMRWHQEAELLAFAAIFLSAGGFLTERRRKTSSLTLSLPVTRRRWLVLQSLLVLILLVPAILIPAIVFVTGGLILAHPLSVSYVVQNVVLTLLIVSPWIAITLFFSTITGNRLIMILIACLVPLASSMGLQEIGNPFISIVIVGLLALFLAIRRFERMDF